MNLEIAEKVIIVTGGSRGIGEAITRRISDEGAIPVIGGRSSECGGKLVADLRSKGRKAHYVKAELNDVNTCKKIVKETIEKYGHIDALINNAGENDGIGLEQGNPEGFLGSLDKNLYHYYYMAHYCLPWLKKAERASILNISSKTAVTGQGNTSGYAAAKGAQLALTREWAVELLKYEIRVNAILPAEVMTPLYETWIKTFDQPDKKLKSIVENIPLGKRMTTTDEIASLAAFLVSTQASHITGQFLFIDGGYVHLDRASASNQ